jgi:hypothetical protein
LTASEAQSGRRGTARVGQCGGEDETDKRAPYVSGGYREGAENGRRESKEKAYFCNYANGARGPSGLGRPVGFGLREKRGQQGPAGPRLSGLQGRPGRKRRKGIFELKIGFLNLPRLWKFAQGDLGGILT